MVYGVRARGRPSDGPLDHRTGRGWVKAHDGQYYDAIHRHRSKVSLILVEATGGVYPPTRSVVGRLAKRFTGKHAIDRTKYGSTRVSTRSFFAHHIQALSKAAVPGDARNIKDQLLCRKQRAFHLAGGAAHAAP